MNWLIPSHNNGVLLKTIGQTLVLVLRHSIMNGSKEPRDTVLIHLSTVVVGRSKRIT